MLADGSKKDMHQYVNCVSLSMTSSSLICLVATLRSLCDKTTPSVWNYQTHPLFPQWVQLDQTSSNWHGELQVI